MAVVFSHHRETHAAVVQLLRAQAKEDAKVHLAPFEVFEIHGAMDNTKRHAAVREVRLRPRTLGPHAGGGGRASPSAAVHPPLHLTPRLTPTVPRTRKGRLGSLGAAVQVPLGAPGDP